MTYRKDWGQPQQGGQGFARTVKTFGRTVSITSADDTTGNTIGAFMVPQGFVVTGIIAVATDMDSSTGLALSVGDSGSGTRYLSSSAIGQTGSSTTTLASSGLLYKNTADTEVLVTVSTQASGTFTAGTLDLRLIGYMDN